MVDQRIPSTIRYKRCYYRWIYNPLINSLLLICSTNGANAIQYFPGCKYWNGKET